MGITAGTSSRGLLSPTAGGGSASASVAPTVEVEPPTLGAQTRKTVEQWRQLLRRPELRAIYLLNGAYLLAFSGSQMTMLPLLLVEDRFALGPQGIGAVFAGMSAMNVVLAQPGAMAADKFGRAAVLLPACCALSAAQFMLPGADSLNQAIVVLGLWAAGNSLLGSTPSALVADQSNIENRAQALALLRVTGDIGMLLGASLSGAIADASDKGTAMQANSAVLLTATAAFAANSMKQKGLASSPASFSGDHGNMMSASEDSKKGDSTK